MGSPLNNIAPPEGRSVYWSIVVPSVYAESAHSNQPVIILFMEPNSFKFTTSQLFFQLKKNYIANAVVVF